jgi:hypothetical protein
MTKQLVLLAVTMLAATARAQQVPFGDVAVGYWNVNTPTLGASGGGGSGVLNVSERLGVAGDFGLYHSSAIGPGLAGGTYLFGPRFSYRHWRRFTPFAETLAGGVRYSGNGFVYGAGGGADIGLGKGLNFALRPQIEYLGFRANGGLTNTVRVGLSLVFRIRRT